MATQLPDKTITAMAGSTATIQTSQGYDGGHLYYDVTATVGESSESGRQTVNESATAPEGVVVQKTAADIQQELDAFRQMAADHAEAKEIIRIAIAAGHIE